jgi:hypothetical protein
MSRLLARPGLLFACLASACSPAPPHPPAIAPSVPIAAPAPSSATPWRYEVTVAEAASSLAVDVAIPAGAWGHLEVDDRAQPFLRDVTGSIGDAPLAPLARVDRTPEELCEDVAPVFALPACPAGGCRLRYRFALAEAADAVERDTVAARYGGAVLSPPSSWLLRPVHTTEEQAVRLHVTAPAGTAFATGLAVAEGSTDEYAADLSDLARSPFTAFGDLRVRDIAVGKQPIQIARFPGPLDISDDETAAWIGGTARLVQRYFRAPLPRALVLVQPTSGRGIGFGRTLGNGGASILLPVGESTPIADLTHGWELIHELLHVGFPNLEREHAWLAEGMATYVEPLIRARAGLVAPEATFEYLAGHMGFGLPGPGDQGLDHTATWGRTYWGGAIFCLLADVAIRERTGGRRSIDDAFRAVLAAGGHVAYRWDPERVIAIGDGATGVPVLAELYAAHALAPAPVDLPAIWRKLGVVTGAGPVHFDDAAPEAWIRRAMVAPEG